MARYTGPRGKIVRRFGENIFGNPKYDKILEKKNYPPGQHGASRRARPSDYATQLQEKQKIKITYGLYEKQFKRVYQTAVRMAGITGTNMIQLLERRLDNVVYRLGFAASRPQARQFVNHGHFLVNGKKVDIASYLVKPGDKISVRQKSKKMALIHEAMQSRVGNQTYPWLSLDKAKMEGVFLEVPQRDQLGLNFNEQLVVELYSK
ncbi:MAG: 30S ribosomal protein S4 [Candidatus Marinimicrobia bacterium]|nr:30S ribosomal protein S4 [Candidatus Neomarinimicrobiota bacterium]